MYLHIFCNVLEYYLYFCTTVFAQWVAAAWKEGVVPRFPFVTLALELEDHLHWRDSYLPNILSFHCSCKKHWNIGTLKRRKKRFDLLFKMASVQIWVDNLLRCKERDQLLKSFLWFSVHQKNLHVMAPSGPTLDQRGESLETQLTIDFSSMQ